MAILLFSSCGIQRKISVGQPVDVKVESLSRVTVSCTVDNRSNSAVELLEGRFRLHTPKGDYATVLLDSRVAVPRRTTMRVEFSLRVRLADPLSILAALPSDDLLVTGEAVVRHGWVKKKIRIADRLVSQFLDIFGQ